MTRCSNLLELSDPQILMAYKETTRIKFILHVATAMFISPEAEALLMDVSLPTYSSFIKITLVC